MTSLLIDLGNTALKWCLSGCEDEPHTVVHRDSIDYKAHLYEEWLSLKPTRVVGCTVAAPEIAFSMTKFFNDHDIKWEWVRPQARFICSGFSLENKYARAGQLGSDRWYAAIGAVDAIRTISPEESLLVVQMGTCATVDAILNQGGGRYEFLGGRIAPGPTLMQKILADGIPALAVELGQWEAFPESTQDALATGILDAQAGLVRLALAELEKIAPSVRVLLSGGASSFVSERLRTFVPNLIVRHNLVLRGLAARAAVSEWRSS